MGDFISREAALSFPFANGQYDHENANEHFINGCESYKEWLEVVPAADVVEVVRCKDCCEYDTTGYDDTPGFGWCECLHKEVQSCFYCAHGEKGENR